MKTRQAPVQGPCGAPFRPGDRFRWTSGNGLTVRTGTIIEWQEHVSERMQELYGWGSWFVQVDPLPKPRGRPMTDDEREIQFPTSICSITTPHVKHRIEGTWREQCPGVEVTAEQTQGARDWPTAWDGEGNVIVPGAARASGEWQLCPGCGDPVTGACRPGACANPNHCAVCGQPSGDMQVCDPCTNREEARMKRADDI